MQQKRPSQSSTSEKTQSLPDIARDSTAQTAAMLDRVGMSGIETVLRRRSPEGELFLMPAKADAFVNLDDPEARGIHMSRLYLDLQRLLEENEFTFPLLQKALEAFTRSIKSATVSFSTSYSMRAAPGPSPMKKTPFVNVLVGLFGS